MNAHRPRKRFGQNFLHDQQVIDQIVACIAPHPSEVLVEIGPGQAALTRPLVASGAELHVVEIDRDLAAQLQRLFASEPGVTIHACDALNADLAALTGDRPFRLIGNLPYNISTPLIFHVLKWHGLILDMHFMLQKEVVERMAAGPGGHAYGRLSVMAQYRCEVTPLFDVRPESFTPVPAVHSSVVRLRPLSEPPVDAGSDQAFARVVSAAFSQRRKTLRNSLRALLTPAQIEAAGVDPGERAEQLSLSQFAALSRALSYDAQRAT
ncbi:MAG: 16S rRNA (adenine(1518)-N(6)/adenine(1519)-N(6))-dimethyltransferase RsmA [Lysobacterales bacterium]